MSLSIGTALKDGFHKVASRTGAILIAAYLVVYVMYFVAINSTLKAYATQDATEMGETFALALDLPVAVGGVLVVLSLLLLTYLGLVAMRTFVADARDALRREDLTGGVAFAIANLVVGYLAYSVLVTVGFVLLVVPGVFLMVALAFMPLFVAVEDDNFVTAMRRSWRLTAGSRIALFVLGLVVVGIGFAVGMVIGIGAVIGMLVGIDQSILTVLQMVVTAPVSMYSLAVLASAFDLLRGDSGEFGESSTTTEAPSTPA